MPSIPYSCPHFDSAKEHLDQCDTLLDKVTDEIADAMKQIEKAREINGDLRTSAESWEKTADEFESRCDELEDRIRELEGEITDLQSTIADIE